MTQIFRRLQIRTMLLCWIVYAVIYFGRLNLSVALPELQNLLGVSKAEIGLLGTLFFWFYAIGQLFGGILGDKVSVRKLIFIGLFFSGFCNLLFSFSHNLFWMAVLWAFNGVFQSLIWSPLVKTIVRWVEPIRRNNSMIFVSTSMVGGFILAWGLLGIWVGKNTVSMLFLVPALTMLATAVIWFLFMRNRPKDFGIVVDWAEKEAKQELDRTYTEDILDNTVIQYKTASSEVDTQPSIFKIAAASHLWLIIIACFAQGIVRDGITLWAPTFFLETQAMEKGVLTASLLFLPFMNFIGILLAGWLSERLGNRVESSTAILFLSAMALLGCLFIFGRNNGTTAVILLGLSSGMMYGVNTLLVGVIPLQFEHYGRAASMAGLFNFLAYVASGFASAFTGLLVDLSGWQGVLGTWALLAGIGTLALFFHEWIIHHKRQQTML